MKKVTFHFQAQMEKVEQRPINENNERIMFVMNVFLLIYVTLTFFIDKYTNNKEEKKEL